ncbi:hydantoinase/oxoprolinase family protein, partial [Mycobacterium tuberculosis]|nr:hydantoinase/oxoprolinase family protein [Mycobacterium tuberculosis]
MVDGGFEFDGRELVPLDEKAVAAAARQIRADGIETVAISGVFSPLNPAHELRTGEILRNEHPD